MSCEGQLTPAIHRVILILAAVTGVLAELGPSQATVLHVSPSGNGTDGLTWTTAFPTLGQALAAAQESDTIWVREGLYPETVRLVPEVSVYGGFSGTEMDHEFHLRDPDLHPTTIRASEGTLFALV